MSDRVLLTGISGFLGGHVALALLNSGYAVRGSLRNLNGADRVRTTLLRAGADISKLEIATLDLTSDRGWDEAMSGCKYLMHIASPAVAVMPKDPETLIRPAVEGTRRAINAALKAKVEHIVLTSSTSAIKDGHPDYSKSLTSADWTSLSSPKTNAYARSKTLAEQEAWRLVEAAGSRETLSVINPSLILGPLLDDDEGTSSALVKMLLDGKLPAAPNLYFSIIDVRDVAALHLDALTNPKAAGTRCIGAVETLPVPELARRLKPAFPARKVPTGTAPDFLVRLMAMFNPAIRDTLDELGRPKRLDTNEAALRLGRPLIGVTQAAIATANSLIEFGHL